MCGGLVSISFFFFLKKIHFPKKTGEKVKVAAQKYSVLRFFELNYLGLSGLLWSWSRKKDMFVSHVVDPGERGGGGGGIEIPHSGVRD